MCEPGRRYLEATIEEFAEVPRLRVENHSVDLKSSTAAGERQVGEYAREEKAVRIISEASRGCHCGRTL